MLRNVWLLLRVRASVLPLTLALFLAATSIPASAGVIEPVRAKLTASEDAYVLSAEFKIELGSRLEEVVSRGVPLYFTLEFDLTRSRWYWSNEHIAGRNVSYRLAYHALTRQYRLSSGALHQNFASLADALRILGRVAAAPIVEKSALKTGETYQAALRLALDRQQLPKPFQLDAIANRDWQVEAKVLNWQFTPGTQDNSATADEKK